MKLARPVLFLALTALLATCAQASVPSASATLAPNHFERLSAPSLSAALDVASLEPRDDAPRFALDEVSLLGEPRSVRFHLTGDELRPQPLTVFEPSYPETRVGAFDFLGTPLVGVSSGVSHELQRGCGDSWLGTPEGIGNWLSEDPAGDIDSPNRYAYVAWRPNEFVDPTGEGLWNPLDWASLGLGLWSFGNNLSEGNFGWAAVDLLGVAADTAGMVYQLPTGMGSIIAGTRAARAVHGIQTASHLVNAGQGIYQAGQELRQGNDGAAALYSLTSALGFMGASRSIAHGFGYEFRPMRGTANSGVPVTLERIDQNGGPYTARGVQATLEARYPGGVTSHTIAPARAPGGNVGYRGVHFDGRNFPVFDSVARFDTRLPDDVARVRDRLQHGAEATRQLAAAIARGEVSASRFGRVQLEAIMAGEAKIPWLTWHHHQEYGRMQLVSTRIHRKIGHIGGFRLWY